MECLPLSNRLLFQLMLVTLLSGLTYHAAENAIFPDTHWTEATPEPQGMDGAKLNEAYPCRKRSAEACRSPMDGGPLLPSCLPGIMMDE